MAFSRWPAVLLTFAMAAPVGAKTRPCTRADAMAAEDATDVAHKSWAILNTQYLKYARAADCDDGAIAEGWSDAVARLLANAWDELPTLARLVKADPEFLPFVVRHIDATADTDDLERVRANAERRCPPGGYEQLCRVIATAATGALADGSTAGASPPPNEVEARRRLSARAPGIEWSTTTRVDLDGDGVPDFAMLGKTQSQAVIGVVLGAAAEGTFVFTFQRYGTRHKGLCGDPAAARIVAEALAPTTDPDAPPGAKGRPGARRGAFRLESGECDALHFYFDGLAVRWWRR